MTAHPQKPEPLFLGIEGGGSHSVAILADAEGDLIQRFDSGPANLRLLNDQQLQGLYASIANTLPKPNALGIGMAGALSEVDLLRIRTAAAKAWAGIPCYATNDLETALAATRVPTTPKPFAQVLVLSGTGSCCYGRNSDGKSVKIGGWGHLIGDKGSGYEIGLRALKAVVHYFDRDGALSLLGKNILHRLQLNEPVDLVAWAQGADKSQIASLAMEVFAAAKKRDFIARDILTSAANTLAKDAILCAKKLTSSRNSVTYFTFAGSILLKQPQFAKAVERQLKQSHPNAVILPLKHESVWGAITLAQNLFYSNREKITANADAGSLPIKRTSTSDFNNALTTFAASSPTEQRNLRSLKLDKMPFAKAIELMLSEDETIPAAIRAEKPKIEQVIKLIARAFSNQGRLFYVGAGTSGRLGVLDASECPPTFRTPPELVQGIIAGGQGALWRSVEGAEDDFAAGGRAIELRDLTSRDVVVGITASGRTPFVWGALKAAKKNRAKTVLLAFNPSLKIPVTDRPTVIITPNVGPEILTGSTRLKAGTATKLILNIFTTLAMVQTGKVISNLMVDLNPSNVKLRNRAVRIVQDLRGVDYATAESALQRGKWNIKIACEKLKR